MERDDTFLDDKHVSLPPNWSIESMQSQQKFKQVFFFFRIDKMILKYIQRSRVVNILKKIFYWCIIALQCWVTFCCIGE